jgi:peptide chain release factor 2
VRITHIPTGIVVTCQNERSQIGNKEIAFEVLKNKLYNIELEKKNQELDSLKGTKMTIGFGSGKRSYVMCPYTLVKDNASGYETSDVNGILDGNIGEMLEKNIRS